LPSKHGGTGRPRWHKVPASREWRLYPAITAGSIVFAQLIAQCEASSETKKFRRSLFSCKVPPLSADYIGIISAREFVSRIRGNDMKPDRRRLPKNTLFSDDAWRPDLEALETAKARQDHSHRKLDKFISATIAELNRDDSTA
jgi:hypothetical protein